MPYFKKADASTRKAILDDVDMTEESLKSDMNSLRDWLSKQPHLPQETNESLLNWFIIGCKSLERAKERIDKYFTARAHNPSFYAERNSDIIRKDKSLRPLFLTEVTPQGERVIIMRSEDVGANDYDHASHLIFTLMMVEIMFRESGPSRGLIVVYDLKYFTTSHMARTNVFENARVFKLVQVLPIRVKSIRVINAPTFIETLVNTVFKPFVPKKISDRVSISSEGEESLKNFFPSSMLPTEYGGTSNKSCSDILYEQFKLCEQWEDWFNTEGSKLVDEEKRPSSSSNSAYGVAGSFRKLNLD